MAHNLSSHAVLSSACSRTINSHTHKPSKKNEEGRERQQQQQWGKVNEIRRRIKGDTKLRALIWQPFSNPILIWFQKTGVFFINFDIFDVTKSKGNCNVIRQKTVSFFFLIWRTIFYLSFSWYSEFRFPIVGVSNVMNSAYIFTCIKPTRYFNIHLNTFFGFHEQHQMGIMIFYLTCWADFDSWEKHKLIVEFDLLFSAWRSLQEQLFFSTIILASVSWNVHTQYLQKNMK